jgi:carbonic anhydrase
MNEPVNNSGADETLARLQYGNRSFVSGVVFYPPVDGSRRAESVKLGQHPGVAILSCSDSRVPLELIFNLGIGDAYTIRVSGNSCNGAVLGSLEHAVAHLGTPLLLVLGHSHCGALTSVLQGMEYEGHLAKLVAPLEPVVQAVLRDNPGRPPLELLEQATVANVWNSIAQILGTSPVIHQAAREGRVRLEGAVYDLLSGQVEWLGRHPGEAALLGGEQPGV